MSIIGYGWHHISVIILHETVELYWHRLNTLNGVTWNICRGTFCSSKSLSNSACKSVSAKRKSPSVVLISLEFFSLLPTLDIFSVLDVSVVFANRDLSEYHSNNLKFHASFCHLTWSECPRTYCRLFVYLFVKLN